jgi:hypothetical protein
LIASSAGMARSKATHFPIHVEQFTLVQTEAFDNILERVGMNRLLESLSQ